jgi:hypothetical protein
MNSLQPNASFQTDTPTRVGQRRADNYWNGTIQDLRIYDRQLSEPEIVKLIRNSELARLLTLEKSQRTPERLTETFHSLAPLVDHEYRARLDALSALELEYERIRSRSPITHIQRERTDSEPQTHLLMRGEYDKKGELIKANTPSALHPMGRDLPLNRLGLAHWVVDPANPLTARVTVNRFWQEIFGSGLVATPEDFGVMGSPPSNPDLLDWLAVDFVEHDWNVKRIFKQIFASATYRQATRITPDKLELDPQNALFSRGPRFRLDAEMIRDTALQASGLLSSKMYGPSTKPYQPENIWNVVGLPEGNTRVYQQDEGENLYRRSVYTFWKRMAHPPNMEVLNAPSREVCVVKRERTNTPLQALVLLNDPIFVESARQLAQRILLAAQTYEPGTVSLKTSIDNSRLAKNILQGESLVSENGIGQQDGRQASETGLNSLLETGIELNSKDSFCLNEIAKRVLCRRLSEKEVEILAHALLDYRKHYRGNPKDAEALLKVGQSAVDDRLDVAELAAWTIICQQFLNLDEAVTK